MGSLGNMLAPITGSNATTALIKLPAILADIGVGALLFHIVRGWVGPGARANRLALIAAGIYLFNPVTWYDSAVWGQTDAVGALVILLGLAALIRGNSEGALAIAVLAALVKPQFGVVLGALVMIVLLKRHLLAPGSGPQHRPIAPPFMRSWLEGEHGVWRLISSLTVGLIVLLVLITPFRLDLPGLIALMAKAAGGYEYLTVNAYNAWALIGSDGRTGLAFGGGWSPDNIPLLGPLPGVAIGAALLVIGFAIGLLRVAWRDDRRSLFVVATFLALAFFILPTRVHERYLFPVFALLPVLAVQNRRWLWITIVLSVASFINLHGILTTPLYATDNLKGLPLGEFFRQPPAVFLSVVLHMAGFVFVALALRRSAAAETEAEDALIPSPIDAVATADDLAEPATGPRVGPAVAPMPSEAQLLLADVRNFIKPLISIVPLRRDRSAELAGEPVGRIGRIDLLLLAVVFIAALGLRTLRLEQPYGMHFDEVYHARTATEFLENWRYGIVHSIYEYTHPHMAKYLIAEGITFFGNNQVVGSTELGLPVDSAEVERRWAPTGLDTSVRNGDRFYVLSGSEVRAYDLMSRAHVATIPVSAVAMALDETNHVLYLADATGTVWDVETGELDQQRTTATAAAPAAPAVFTPSQIAQLDDLDGQLIRLEWTSDRLVAITDVGLVVSIDPATGTETGRATVAGAADVVQVEAGLRLVLDMPEVTDLEATITNLATFAGGDVNVYRARVAGREGKVVLEGYIDEESDLTDKISAAGLTGVTVDSGKALAVAGFAGVEFLDSETLDPLLTVETASRVTGFAYVDRGVEKPTLYSASGSFVQQLRVPAKEKPSLGERIEMPGPVSQVVFNPSTTLVHVLGRTPDGRASTIYVIEPHGNAVFADARLPFDPDALVVDTQPMRPADDRNDILAFSPTGTMATVDVGSNAFAWRFMGVLAGALMAMCIYLLTRFLFRRRSIAIIAAALVLLDGMAFANARIAMNDTYVAFFIVAAVTVFAPIWLGRWRSPLVVVPAIIAVGVLLGLALASKWVGAYAIGGVLLLILLRSALGRIVALLGMIALTAVLGFIGIMADGTGSTAGANYTFLIMMIGLTCLLAIAMALRPVRMSKDELRLAVLGPFLGGLLAVAAGIVRAIAGPSAPGALLTPTLLLTVGLTLVLVGIVAFVIGRVAAGYGYGPWAPPRELGPGEEGPAESPAPAWLRPGGGPLGLPWLATLGALVVIPIAIYAWSYAPWVAVGGRWTTDNPPGNPGQTLIDLQFSMYRYHNDLRATHPASSPWWAWPFDLKPVWFEQGGYAAKTASSIYDSGNLVIFWLAIPAFAFLAYQAWRRRSLALTFVALMVLSLWLPWVRIDRATFQYHFFTTLPFAIIGLAYFLAELWHGPSTRTWLLARASAALAVMGPALLWVLRQPLCGLAGTQLVNANTEACAAATRTLVLTDLQAVAMLVAIGGLLGLAWLIWWPTRSAFVERNRQLLVPIGLVLVLAGLVLALVGAVLPGTPVFSMAVGAFELPLLFVFLSAVPAYYVLRARDARRFAVSAMVIAGLWFVVWFPNFSGLPIPEAVLTILNNALSPTYNWGFQFAVNKAPASNNPIDWTLVGMLAGVLFFLALAAFYAARSWRIQREDERMLRMAQEPG